jgi:hypothetical protein
MKSQYFSQTLKIQGFITVMGLSLLSGFVPANAQQIQTNTSSSLDKTSIYCQPVRCYPTYCERPILGCDR